MEKICMKGVGGVERVTMYPKAGQELADGMAVTLTGENEVGFGDAGGSPVFGIVCTVEKTPHGDKTVGVQTSGFHDAVKMTATAAKQPAVGAAAYCNDKGELVKVDNAAPSRAVVTAVDVAAKTATIVL